MSAPTFTGHLNFQPRISARRCVLCNTCTRICQTGALYRNLDGKPATAKGRCRNCRACFRGCEQHAITLDVLIER